MRLIGSRSAETCPRMEALSALVDGELVDGTRAEIKQHAVNCPICGAALAELGSLRAAFGALPQPVPSVDIAHLVSERIRVGERRVQRAPGRPRMPWRRWMPAAIGAAAALGMGAGAANVLMAGVGAASRASVEMSVFATVPPGGLCLAGPACR